MLDGVYSLVGLTRPFLFVLLSLLAGFDGWCIQQSNRGAGNGVVAYYLQNTLYLWVPDLYILLVLRERAALCNECSLLIKALSAR